MKLYLKKYFPYQGEMFHMVGGKESLPYTGSDIEEPNATGVKVLSLYENRGNKQAFVPFATSLLKNFSPASPTLGGSCLNIQLIC